MIRDEEQRYSTADENSRNQQSGLNNQINSLKQEKETIKQQTMKRQEQSQKFKKLINDVDYERSQVDQLLSRDKIKF